MGNYNVDLTADQTNTGPIRVTYAFSTPVDPRAAMVIAADFGKWLVDQGVTTMEVDTAELPRLAAEFIEKWADR